MEGNGATAAILLMVSATFALDVYSTLNSSPQTTELFAGERDDSLMHWVWIGDAAALAGGTLGTLRAGNAYPMVGALAVVVMMHLLYRHAVKRGMGQQAPSNAAAPSNVVQGPWQQGWQPAAVGADATVSFDSFIGDALVAA